MPSTNATGDSDLREAARGHATWSGRTDSGVERHPNASVSTTHKHVIPSLERDFSVVKSQCMHACNLSCHGIIA